LLVDPLAEDADRLAGRIERDGLRLRHVVDTHTHADHLSGGAEIARRLSAPDAAPQSAAIPGGTEKLRDGQAPHGGDGKVGVLHTPGHTPDSISLRAGDALMTGDFLFLAQDGAGRLDLPGGDAGAHWDSLQRLSRLGDDLRVLPGHDYNELTDSTLGV